MISFSDIIGREQTKNNIVRDMTRGKLSHAYLLIGPVGVGKKIFARSMANAILCLHPENGLPCMKCTHCKSQCVNGVTELYELNNEGKSIKVDEIREIVKSMSLKPVQSNKKVYVIYDGENMTNQAQNSLLKTLEEPPEYGHVIITVNNIDNILPTIISRTQTINIGINSNGEVTDYLSNICEEGNNVEMAVEYAQGSIGKGIEIMQSKVFESIRENADVYVNGLINKEESKCFESLKSVDKNNVYDFLSIIIKLFKDMIVYKETQNDKFLINKDKKYIINNGINKYNSSVLLNIVFVLEDTNIRLKGNASRKSTLDGMTVKILEELIND